MKKTFFAVFLCMTVSATAQVESNIKVGPPDIPQFFVDTPSFSSNDSLVSRVDLYSQVPYDALLFAKKETQFVAKYEITFNFLDADNALALEKSWTEEIRAETFEQTQSKLAYSLTERSVTITPGIYTLRCKFRDIESNKVATLVKKVVVGNYSYHDLTLSDILLVKKVTSSGERKKIVPNVTGNIGDNNNSFYLFFEIYSPLRHDSLDIHYIVNDIKGHEMLNRVQIYPTTSRRTQIIAHFDSIQYTIGAYTVTVSVKSFNDTTDVVPVLKQKSFAVRWGTASPLNITDLDLAIRQMRYILNDEEYSQLSDAKTEAEKRKLFEEFWRRRDPNPDTKRNEFMEDYYARVQYANEHFSNYTEGWRTDMGMVFILLGAPNNVERHPFDIDSKPYEVWSYYDLNRRVVFLDETGFGDYRLLTPIWDLLQHLKY